jgi:hypothetical protein
MAVWQRCEAGALSALFSLFSLFFAANLQPDRNGRPLLSTEAAVSRLGEAPSRVDFNGNWVTIIKSTCGLNRRVIPLHI